MITLIRLLRGAFIASLCALSATHAPANSPEAVLSEVPTLEQADEAIDRWEANGALSDEDILAIIPYLGYVQPNTPAMEDKEFWKLNSGNEMIRDRAKDLLNNLVPTNRALYIALERQLDDPEAVPYASFILLRWGYSNYGPEVGSIFVNRLASRNLHVSGEMADKLRSFDIQKEDDIDLLGKLLKYDEPVVRTRALEVVGFQCERRVEMVARLEELTIPTLQDDDPGVRRAAVEAVNQLGRLQLKSLCYLTIPLLNDADETVRQAVSKNLAKFLLTSQDYEQLAKLLREGNADVQYQALHLIATGGEEAQVAVPSLIACLNKKELEATAIEALPRIVGSRQKQAFDFLNDCVKSPDEYIRFIAVSAMAKLMESRHEPFGMTVLLECIEHEQSPRVTRIGMELLWRELDESTFINRVWWRGISNDSPEVCLIALSYGDKLTRPIPFHIGVIVQHSKEEHRHAKIREECQRLWPKIEDKVLPERE